MSGEKEEASFNVPRVCGITEERRDVPGSSAIPSEREQSVQYQQESLPSTSQQSPAPSTTHGEMGSVAWQPEGIQTLEKSEYQATGLSAGQPGEDVDSGASATQGSRNYQPCSQDPSPEGQLLLSTIPPVPEGAVVTQRLPYCAWKVGRLCHQRAVRAIAISGSTQHVYTCGTNYMKVWDQSALRAWNKAPVYHLKLEGNSNCIFTCKLLPDERSLVTGGRLHGLNIWDLTPTPHLRARLASEGIRCFSTAISSDGHILMACFSEFVEIWDLRNHVLIRKHQLPGNGNRYVDITGPKFWTAGEQDTNLYTWDLRTYQHLDKYNVEQQILGITHDPSEEWVLVGLQTSEITLCHVLRGEKYQIRMQLGESYNYNLKFASSGSYFVTTMNQKIYGVGAPSLRKLFQVVEDSSAVLCFDMSSDNQYLITGSLDTATVYEQLY
ncbi:transducin-like enhancer protein 7 isoform X2 [Tenrec ecaudatus]|uniref:transducin-like enhancer protein 7 isoform X2 n=1 Tax=Tenrec ecaudatus TaxID=94439 RepID=UPI003F598C23